MAVHGMELPKLGRLAHMRCDNVHLSTVPPRYMKAGGARRVSHLQQMNRHQAVLQRRDRTPSSSGLVVLGEWMKVGVRALRKSFKPLVSYEV